MVQYQEFSALWVTDQQEALTLFLKYGRDLTADDLDMLDELDDEGNLIVLPSPPTLDDFKSKVREKVR